MATYRIINIFHSITGLADDDVVTRYHFETTEAAHTAATAQNLNGHVAASWENPSPATSYAAARYISAEISRVNLPTVKAYNPIGGSPLAMATWAGMSAALDGANGAMPSEVACCLSYNADLVNIPEVAPDDADPDLRPERPASRRRGRIFVGPLSVSAKTPAPARPETNFRTTLLWLGRKLATPTNPLLTAIGATWVVRSDSGSGIVNYPVIRVSVDDAFDTQRRRGIRAASRVFDVL